MGFADIASDVTGALENIGSAFGLLDTKFKHPSSDQFKAVINHIDETDKSWRKSVGYGFRVVRVSEDGTTSEAAGWQDFILQINPQELTQDEIFAIQVTPTFSGVLVEHQGTTLKDIIISGTTGISPNRREGGAFAANGRPAFAEGRSGYMEFHELRNYIRVYVEAKRNDKEKDKGELRLVWDNLKDHESIYVEPQKFTMKRSAAKPHMYEYNFAMKGIGIATEKSKDLSWLEVIDDAIEDTYSYIENGVKILQGASGFVQRLEREIVSTVITPFQLINQFLQAASDLKEVSGIGGRLFNKLSMQKLGADCKRINDNLYNELQSEQIEAYNAAKGNVVNKSLKLKVTYQALKVANAFQKLIKATIRMQKSALFEKDLAEDVAAVNALYASANQTAARSAALALLEELEKQKSDALRSGNIKESQSIQEQIDEVNKTVSKAIGKSARTASIETKNSAATQTINGDTTIQELAAQFLGSPDKFKELVMLNNLKPPYIDPTPLDEDPVRVEGVLRPGDIIYVPQSGSATNPSGVVQNDDIYPINAELSDIQKNFGIDVQLDDDYDIAISSVQDMKLVGSYSNVAQAVLLRLLLDPGSLKRHPEIGTSLSIGRKVVDPRNIVTQVRRSLSSDSRIESVVYAKVTQESNATLITLVLKLKGVDQTVKVPVTLPAAA